MSDTKIINESGRPVHRNVVIATVLGAMLVLASVVFAIANGANIRLGDVWVETSQTEVDLNGSGITTAKGLVRLEAPEFIDLRGNNIPPEEVLAVKEKHPDCEILWSVPIGDRLIDADMSDITVTGMTAEEVPLLLYFDRLESIDARGLELDTVKAINALSLNCKVEWDIALGENRFDHDAEEVVVGADADAQDIQNLLEFDNLKSVDAKACTQYEALMEIAAKLPECSVVWAVPFGPAVGLSTDEVLDFKRAAVEDIDALEKDFENLKYLPALKKVDMSGCGVPSEKMAEWRDKYPEQKFVWEISITLGEEVITIPTDIKVFSSLRTPYIPHGDQDTYREIFLYCTDLVALDLGHNKITDISLITNLKKLQAVILMDNPIKDFSPLGELPELVFAEINKTKFRDLSFVKGCPKLMHLDISETPSKDITPLFECKELEYLVLVMGRVSDKDYKALVRNLPDCTIAWVYADYLAVRNSPLRSAYRNAFTNYPYLEYFNDWTDYAFVEGAEWRKPSGYKPPEYYGDDLQ